MVSPISVVSADFENGFEINKMHIKRNKIILTVHERPIVAEHHLRLYKRDRIVDLLYTFSIEASIVCLVSRRSPNTRAAHYTRCLGLCKKGLSVKLCHFIDKLKPLTDKVDLQEDLQTSDVDSPVSLDSSRVLLDLDPLLVLLS